MLSIRTVREADDLFVQHMKTALGGGVLLIAGIVLGMALMQRQVPRDARDTISYCFNTAWRMDFHREAFKKYGSSKESVGDFMSSSAARSRKPSMS
jgi:hypothetical protein